MKLKRVVIKEELVELTGDYRSAIILNQFIYWSERVSDFDKFIEEENQRLINNGFEEANIEPQNGWIYKKADELIEECMVKMTVPTCRKYIKILVDNGWIEERNNPKYAWDKVKQYRVNINKLQKDLNSIGYNLDGYKMAKIPNLKNLNSNLNDLNSNLKNLTSCDKNLSAIPEITNRDYKTESRGRGRGIESRLTENNNKVINKDIEDIEDIEVKDNPIIDIKESIINTYTDLLLTNSQKQIVKTWNINILGKAIEIYLGAGATQFNYLLKVYRDLENI